jgi:hypothetical protein
MAIHLGPSVARRLLRPTRGLGSAPLTVAEADGSALLFGLAPGGVCPFHSVRRLAPPAGIVTVALVLASRRAGVTRHPALRSSDFPHTDEASLAGARPSDRLADRRIVRARVRGSDRASGAGSDGHRSRSAGIRAIDGQVREGIGHRVLGTRDMRRGPAIEARQ